MSTGSWPDGVLLGVLAGYRLHRLARAALALLTGERDGGGEPPR